MKGNVNGTPFRVHSRSVQRLRPASRWANGARGGCANGDCVFPAFGSLSRLWKATGRPHVSLADAQLGESPVSGVEPRRRVTKDVGQSTLSFQSATSEGGEERLRRDISGGALRSGDGRGRW